MKSFVTDVNNSCPWDRERGTHIVHTDRESRLPTGKPGDDVGDTEKDLRNKPTTLNVSFSYLLGCRDPSLKLVTDCRRDGEPPC